MEFELKCDIKSMMLDTILSNCVKDDKLTKTNYNQNLIDLIKLPKMKVPRFSENPTKCVVQLLYSRLSNFIGCTKRQLSAILLEKQYVMLCTGICPLDFLQNQAVDVLHKHYKNPQLIISIHMNIYRNFDKFQNKMVS